MLKADALFIRVEGETAYELHPLTTDYPGDLNIEVRLASVPTTLLALVTHVPPTVEENPSLSGEFLVGQTLTANAGSASGHPNPVFDKFFYEKNGQLIDNENGGTINLAGFSDMDRLVVGVIWKSVIAGEDVYATARSSPPYVIRAVPEPLPMTYSREGDTITVSNPGEFASLIYTRTPTSIVVQEEV